MIKQNVFSQPVESCTSIGCLIAPLLEPKQISSEIHYPDAYFETVISMQAALKYRIFCMFNFFGY